MQAFKVSKRIAKDIINLLLAAQKAKVLLFIKHKGKHLLYHNGTRLLKEDVLSH